MSGLTWDGTAGPVSRDQILRRERGQGKHDIPCLADHKKHWQPYPVDPYSVESANHTSSATVQVSNAFPQVPAQVVRLFGNSETVLPRVYNFLDGGEDDPCALYFFADKESTCLRQAILNDAKDDAAVSDWGVSIIGGGRRAISQLEQGKESADHQPGNSARAPFNPLDHAPQSRGKTSSKYQGNLRLCCQDGGAAYFRRDVSPRGVPCGMM